MHGTVCNCVERPHLLESRFDLLDQGALTRADWPHEVEHLADFFPFQGGGAKVTHDLHDGLFSTEELSLEEVVHGYRLVLIESFYW